MKIMFKEDINFDVILTFDGKDQEFYNCNMKLAVDTTEKDLVHSILIGGFVKENLDYYPDALLDLCKLSVSVSCKEKDFLKLPCIKALLKRNGKYYFQPDPDPTIKKPPTKHRGFFFGETPIYISASK